MSKNNLKPQNGYGKRGAQAKDFKQSMKKLIKYLKPVYFWIFVSVLFTIGSCIMTILAPSRLSDISTNVAYLQSPLTNHKELLNQIDHTGKILVIMYGTSFVCSFLQGFIMAGINQAVSKKFRSDLQSKINRIPLAYFDHSSIGDTLSRITNDVDTIGQAMNSSITSMVSAITLLIGLIIAMFVTCWQMALTALASVPITMICMGIIAKISQRFFKDQQVALGKLNGIIEENYSGAVVIKSFNAEARAIEEFEKANDRIYQNAWKSNFLTGLMMPINMFISNLDYVAICVVGGFLFKNGEIEIGVLTAFIVYLNLFKSPTQQMAQAMSYLQQMAAAAERVFEFLDVEEQASEDEKHLKVENCKGYVEFKNVDFSYYPEKPIIKDFSATVKPGQKVAIVGPTGAGKTTIVNLLMRFYEINSGSIFIDDVNTLNMKREDVRALFSMVLQDTWIFNGTIRENIVYDKENVTDEELDKVCKAANIDKFIAEMPNGYDTVLSETTSLSEGQRQLITIARAMIQNAPMLILDEATSNVDTRTEILIQNAMDELMKDRTSFVIAHRLSTIKNADLILVLKDGNIIEQGNHDELIELDGFYAKLYNSQFEE